MSSDEETFSELSFDLEYKFAALDDCIRDAIAKEPLLRFPIADQDTVQWLGCLEEIDNDIISVQKAAGCLEEADKFSKTKLAVAIDNDKQKISAQPLEWQLKQCNECCEQYLSPVNLRRHAWIKHAKPKEMNILVTNNDRLSVYWDEKVEEETRQDESTVKGRSTKMSSDKLSFKELWLNDILDNVDNVLNTLDNRHKFYSAAYELKGLVLNQDLLRSSTLLSALHTLSERNSLQATRTPEMHEAMFGKDIKRVALEKENVLASLAFILEHYLVKSYDDDAAAKEPERQGLNAELKKPWSKKVKSNTKGLSKEIREVDNSNHEHNNEGKDNSHSSEPTFGSSVNLPASIEQASDALFELSSPVEENMYSVHSPASDMLLQQEAVDAVASAHDNRPTLGVPVGKQQQITSEQASQPQISLRNTVISSLKSLYSRGNPIQLSNASACSSDVVRLASILEEVVLPASIEQDSDALFEQSNNNEVKDNSTAQSSSEPTLGNSVNLPASVEQGSDALFVQSNNNEVNDNSTAQSSSESTLGNSVNLPASIEQGSNARCELSSPVEAIVYCLQSPASDVPLQQEAVDAVASAHDNRPKLGVSLGKQQQITSQRKLSSPVEAFVYRVHSSASLAANHVPLQQGSVDARAAAHEPKLGVPSHKQHWISLYRRCDRVQFTSACHASACSSDVTQLAPTLEVVLPASVEQGSDAICEQSSPVEAFVYPVLSQASGVANHVPLQQGSVDAQASAHEPKLGVPSHKQHRISLYTTHNTVQFTSACHASACSSDVAQLAFILELASSATTSVPAPKDSLHSTPATTSVMVSTVPLEEKAPHAQPNLLLDGSNGLSSNLSEPADFNLQSPHVDKKNRQQQVFASTKEWVSKTFASDQHANIESLEIDEDTQQVASLVPIADKQEVTPGVLHASVQEVPQTSDADRQDVLVIPNATGSPFHGNACTVVRDLTEEDDAVIQLAQVNQMTPPIPDVKMERLSDLMSKRWKEFTAKGNYFRYVPTKIDPASPTCDT